MGENVLKFGTYVRVGNAAEAYELLQKNRNNKIVAAASGCAWVRVAWRRRLTFRPVDSIRSRRPRPMFRIGAMCTLRQLERHVAQRACQQRL